MTYGDPESIRGFRGNNDLLKYGFVKIELWTFPWFMAYSIVVSVINAFSSSLRPFNQKRNVSTITETFSETSTKIILLKKVFLCERLFFNKVAGFRPATLLKGRLCYRCFSVNFAKFLKYIFYRAPPDDCSCVFVQ